MRVAALVSKHGFAAYQSEHYRDPDRREIREIDVVAMDALGVDGGKLKLTLAIECKTSRDKPWLVLCSAQTDNDGPTHVEDRAASKAGIEFLKRISSREEIQNLTVFRANPRNGYSVVRAFGDGPDVPYAAMMSATKAARALADEATHVRAGYVVAEIVLPIVVVDGLLFEAHLTPDGETSVSPTIHELVYWRNPIAGRTHSVVRVMCIEALPSFLNEVRVAFDKLATDCRDELACRNRYHKVQQGIRGARATLSSRGHR